MSALLQMVDVLISVVILTAPSPVCAMRDMSWMKMDGSALVSVMSKTINLH